MKRRYSDSGLRRSATVVKVPYVCAIHTPERTPYEGDPRHVLRRALARAQEMGFDHYFVGPELEFFYFKLGDDGRPTPLDAGGYFEETTLDASALSCQVKSRPCKRRVPAAWK